MSLFSKQNKEVLGGPLNINNPILVQILGICSALAVTSQLKPAIVMGLAVTVITAFSNVIIGRRCCLGDHRQSDSQGCGLRRECSALGVCRTDHHQLYPHGSSGGFRHDEQALAKFPRWYRQRSRLCHDPGHRRCFP